VFAGIPGGTELVILALVVLLPVALLYVCYQLYRGAVAFGEGRNDARERG